MRKIVDGLYQSQVGVCPLTSKHISLYPKRFKQSLHLAVSWVAVYLTLDQVSKLKTEALNGRGHIAPLESV